MIVFRYLLTFMMAVVPADHERAQDAVVDEVEMDDVISAECKGRFMCVKSESNFVLRRTFSAPSGEVRENDNNFHMMSVNSSSENSNTTTQTLSNTKTNDNCLFQTPRTRTFSADSHTTSQMTLNVDCNSSAASPVSIGSPARRIMQIRREESVDEITREAAKEKDITAAINLSRSLDETSWLGEKHYNCMNMHETHDKPDSIDVMMTPCIPSIPSPVRFIDKLQHNRSLTPSPIGVPISPKQRTYRRSSISPSNLRPSFLSSKRKLDPDDRESYLCSPAKKNNSLFYSPTNTFSSFSSNSSPDRISDTSSTQFSCDDDSGSDHGFTPNVSSMKKGFTSSTNNVLSTNSSSVAPINTLLSCDTRPSQSFSLNKIQYVAPQSPLASGAGNPGLNHDQKRKILGCSSYTFTPVKE